MPIVSLEADKAGDRAVLEGIAEVFKHVIGRRVFPHQISFVLDSPVRKILIAPTQLADRLHLTETSRVLEVGSGSGVFSVEVARRVPRGRLELFDLQSEMLEKAKRKIEAACLSDVCSYTQGEAGDLPFPEASFDVAFLVTVLGEVGDPHKCLQGLYCVIRPGGLLSITEHLPDSDFSSFSRLRSLVEQDGFPLFERFGHAWCYTANFRRPE